MRPSSITAETFFFFALQIDLIHFLHLVEPNGGGQIAKPELQPGRPIAIDNHDASHRRVDNEKLEVN